ncbi:unnamed protein product [Adineta steineri]|uniref:G-protein coupled receptors family 1 profile domain-containing protein n=1 Tax=Adineta steineri TaxID=433720 RepID=A0A818U9F1_9BILA|nr:unnamed protein product [Adineta steineri]CAF3697868.1 unnamed protein product [Adineta steineri]
MSVFFVLNILTIIGDVYGIEFDSPWCILLGYIYAATLCVLYISFINQAFFRLCRIIYCQYKYLLYSSLYIIIFPIEVILAFILACPIYILNNIIYLPNYHFCFVPISDIRAYLWIFFTVYGIPVLSILLIYWRITVFIRKQSNQTLKIRRRQTRDLKAIRGILIIVSFMILFGLPTSFLIVMMLITGEEHPLTFRITCISIGTSMVGLNIAMMFFVPQLKNMVWKTFKTKREVTVNSNKTSSLQMRSGISIE